MKGDFMVKRFSSVFLLIGLCAFSQARAQLAITEVMTSEVDGSHPDWWELTDFGTNSVDLTGYSWNDDSHGGFSGADSAPFTGVTIHPGESIVVTEQKGVVTNATTFRDWWGIGDSVQVVVLNAADPGLGAGGDTVRLWNTNIAALGSNTNGLDLDQAPDFLVDKVDTLGAPAGNSLICNTNDGTFGITNVVGVNGAFVAATTTDVGSPGIASTNPGPIVIVNQPSNVLVNVGGMASFQIKAFGLPKPRFQWLLNGIPVDTNVAEITFAVTNNFCLGTLTITNVQITNAGIFRVNVTNGLQPVVVSSNATLTVNTAPFAPIFTQTPTTSLSAYPGQTVTLTASAFGNPPPTYQWQLNSNNLPDQTDSQLQINVSDTNQSGTYTVVLSNSAGSTNASTVLTVTPKPDLRITEIMSSESSGHNDWWELSNFGDFPVNLRGFRFDDDSAFTAAPFSQALTITNDVIIAPGESIVLVEDMTPDEFREWWGANQLPPNLQIVTYHGSGISFSGTSGDALTVWNAAATSIVDYIDSVSIAANLNQVSFSYDPVNQIFSGINPDGLSVAGTNGAFAAADGGDIGSPGSVINPAHFNNITTTGSGTSLSWTAQPNWNYVVEYKTNLTDASWQTLTSLNSGNTNVMNFFDPATDSQRFYRVRYNLLNQ
ncbi:MAG TPA: immunoglobulin domain-containing protein [Verrucomicrobiae bacterium]|nr:immunoglobulin domain-containing protein [Verrucomicrobiae bacterium]